MFGSTLVEHRLPSRKISGCSLIRQRSRLCSKPGKCRPHVFVLKGLSYHAAITSQYLVKAIQMFPLFEDRSVPELPLHDLCDDISARSEERRVGKECKGWREGWQ